MGWNFELLERIVGTATGEGVFTPRSGTMGATGAEGETDGATGAEGRAVSTGEDIGDVANRGPGIVSMSGNVRSAIDLSLIHI